MFHAAARDLGLRLDRTWYLGDDPRDCTAAWRAGCRCAYIGPPDELESLPVERYVPPAEFEELASVARGMGFKRVASGPLVRSSYHAREMAEDGMIVG